MTASRIRPLLALLLAGGAAVLPPALAQDAGCPPGTATSSYCAGNANDADPPPSTAPAVQPPKPGQAPEVAGTLSGGTQTVEVSSSSNPGTASVRVNLAGTGTLVVKSGDQTITVVVAPSGETTIDPGNGEAPIVVSGAGGAPGTIQIDITPDGVSYSLVAPGRKTVRIGGAAATVPGTATITSSEDRMTYLLAGEGSCTVSLDPTVANALTAGDAMACAIDAGASTTSRAAVSSFGRAPASDVLRLGNLADRVLAGPGRDLVYGNGGADLLRGGSNRDSVHGGAGNDRVFGDGSDDHLYGDAGADRLRGGDGRDFVDGGAGDDVIFVRGQGLDTVACGPGHDVVVAGPYDRVFSDCEVVRRP